MSEVVSLPMIVCVCHALKVKPRVDMMDDKIQDNTVMKNDSYFSN